VNPWPMVISAGAAAAAGVAAWGTVSPSAELFGPTVRHTPSAKALALTFDDGPNPEVTPRLLDLLDRHSARATFFVVGKFARSCPELVRETAARGHLLGNHSETHTRFVFLSPARIQEELMRCQDAVAQATQSEPPRWMRPPYGYRSPFLRAEVRHAGLRGVVMWSRSFRDWKPQPPERLIHKLSRAAQPGNAHGNVILLHDGDHRTQGADRHHVVTALEFWMPRWRDAGLEFVTIELPE
jgi:peptidoglycan/xylan/chitin deacetylase (PgdA/CDA1 family)